MFRTLFTIAAILLAALPARAVIVALDDSAIYTAAPTTDDFGFAKVGRVFDSLDGIYTGGVYLGDGWMLTAYHAVRNGSGGFLFGNILIGGGAFTVDGATALRLHNADNSLTDLALFRLTAEPAGLDGALLAAASPVTGSFARMMGNGQDRQAAETHWTVAGSTWTEVPVGGNEHGYKLAPGAASLRWGNNHVNSAPADTGDVGFGNVKAFNLDFDRVAGEAMATGGDSGGGVFVKNGNQWELAGVMLYTANFSGQPGATAVYGNLTYAADVATYRTEIVNHMATVPEPSAALLALAGTAVFFRRRRG